MLYVRDNILGNVFLKKYNFVFFVSKRKNFGLSEKIIGTVFKTEFSVSKETFPEENILLEKIIIWFFGLRVKNFQTLTETYSKGLSKGHLNCAGEHFGTRYYFEKVKPCGFQDFKQKIFALSEKTFGTVFKTAISVSEENFPAEHILLEKAKILFFGLRAKHLRA